MFACRSTSSFLRFSSIFDKEPFTKEAVNPSILGRTGRGVGKSESRSIAAMGELPVALWHSSNMTRENEVEAM